MPDSLRRLSPVATILPICRSSLSRGRTLSGERRRILASSNSRSKEKEIPAGRWRLIQFKGDYNRGIQSDDKIYWHIGDEGMMDLASVQATAPLAICD
jgi:hypothetical protein